MSGWNQERDAAVEKSANGRAFHFVRVGGGTSGRLPLRGGTVTLPPGGETLQKTPTSVNRLRSVQLIHVMSVCAKTENGTAQKKGN